MNDISILPLDSLVPFAANAKLHSDGQVAQIAASIREFGFNNPVLVKADRTIIAGHGRVLAARKLELKSVPCLVLDHLTDAQASGYDITGLEFFRRKGDAIDVDQVNRMVDAVVSKLGRSGRFDAVVMDYVLNSVDSQQAEEDVLNSIDSLCRPGGTLFFSGRSLDRVEELTRHKTAAYAREIHRSVEFLDENNLTALYRKGSWFFQKFHNDDDVDRMCRARGWSKVTHNHTSIGWNVQARKSSDVVPIKAALESLRREFDMPVNRSGRTLGRAADIEHAFLATAAE